VGPPPVGGTFWFQIFIQASSPETWRKTISGGEEVLAGKWGDLFLGYLLGKNFRRRDRDDLIPPRRMDVAVCRAEVCYPFGREHGRHRAVRRREFITLLGGAAACPLAARAQQAAMPTVGYLYVASPEAHAGRVAAFRKGLSETGYVEGRDVAIEYRWAHNEPARLPGLVADLVNRPVTIIAAGDLPSALAAKAASTTIPIVFETAADPVQAGLVASLNRPEANVTGVTNTGGELGAKRLGLLRELLPGAARFAVLVNPNNPLLAEAWIKDTQPAAAAIGIQLEILRASTHREIDAAFTSIPQKRVDALVVMPDNLFSTRRVQFATQAARHAVPAIYSNREYAEVGGLMSYGTNILDAYRQAGVYVGRILKGEKPANMPVLQPTKFEFVINLQTARTLGLTVPSTLLALADEVIE